MVLGCQRQLGLRGRCRCSAIHSVKLDLLVIGLSRALYDNNRKKELIAISEFLLTLAFPMFFLNSFLNLTNI